MRRRRALFVFVLLALAGLTLTAAAQDQPVDQLEVVSVQTLDVRASVLRTGAFLAPDGESFARVDRVEACLYTLQGAQRWCTNIKDRRIALDVETVRWSPDSRYLVFSADFFRLFVDSDIWLIKADTGEIVNLTDDGLDKIDIFAPDWDKIDVLPRWTSDGKAIIFLRYRNVNGERMPPDVYAIAPDGSSLKQLGTLHITWPFAAFALAVSPDGFKLAFNHYSLNNDFWDGAWLSDLNGRNGTVAALSDPDQQALDVPTALEFSADNRYLMFFTEYVNTPPTAADSRPEIIDLDSFERLALDDRYFVSAAGWSPEGSAVAYIVFDRENEETSGLYLASAPGEPGRLVLPGLFVLPTPRQHQMITWTANHTLLLADGEEFKVTIIRLG